MFDFIPDGEVVDFSSDVFPALLDDGHTLHGHVAEGYWEDVGTLEAYSRAHTDVLDGRVRVEIDGFQLGDRRWIGTDVEISPEARIDDPVVIGDSCRIEAGAHLRPVHRARHRRDREGRRLPRARRPARPRVRRPAAPTCAAA